MGGAVRKKPFRNSPRNTGFVEARSSFADGGAPLRSINTPKLRPVPAPEMAVAAYASQSNVKMYAWPAIKPVTLCAANGFAVASPQLFKITAPSGLPALPSRIAALQ